MATGGEDLSKRFQRLSSVETDTNTIVDTDINTIEHYYLNLKDIPPRSQKNLETFRSIWNAGFHGRKWRNETWLVGDCFPRPIRNTPEEHAEIKMIRMIKNGEWKLKKETKIYLSYSPCSDCSARLQQFCAEEGSENLTVRIIFSQLYKIKRNSCEDRGCGCCTEMENKRNQKGLRDLRGDRIIIETFGRQEWENLIRLLHLPNAGFDEFYESTKKIPNELNPEGFEDNTRREEDELMYTDLEDVMMQD